jgi:hypothetical protein
MAIPFWGRRHENFGFPLFRAHFERLDYRYFRNISGMRGQRGGRCRMGGHFKHHAFKYHARTSCVLKSIFYVLALGNRVVLQWQDVITTF